MKKNFLIFFLSSIFIADFVYAKNKDQGSFAIYGPDDRKEAFEISDPALEKLSRATAAIFVFYKINVIDKVQAQIRGKSLKDSQNICEEEKFSDQIAAAYCSGVLIGKDLLLTAGHCFKLGKLACWGSRIVFDYRLKYPGQDPRIQPRANVYSCVDILHQNTTDEMDYAILRLDRPVTGERYPVQILPDNPVIHVSDPILMIGNPFGIPQKIVSGVVRTVNEKTFTTNLDALNNNSGSPVFSLNNKLIGLLVSGEKDLVYDRSRSCNILNRCQNDECLGESVQSVAPLREFIQQSLGKKNLLTR